MVLKNVLSKTILKIGLLSLIQIIFIIAIFGTLTYIQSQQTLLGNTINIAGKNRFLTINLLYEISEFLSKSSSANTSLENYSTSRISNAEQQLASNIMVLKDGGITSAVQLKPLPSDFLDAWNKVDSHWTDLKTTIQDQIYDRFAIENIKINTEIDQTVHTGLDNSLKEELISKAFNLVNSSDALVTQISQKVESNWDELIKLQIIFGVLIVILILFILFIFQRLLRPITLLTRATSEIKKREFGCIS